MIAESEIRQRLARYLARETSLDQFEDWLVKQSWNMHRDSEEAAQKLVSAVELRLAEHSSGHLDEPALREQLIPFVTKYSVPLAFFGGTAERVTIEPPLNQALKPEDLQAFQVLQVAWSPAGTLLPPAGVGFVDTKPEAVFG